MYAVLIGSVSWSRLLLLLAPKCEVIRNIVGIKTAWGRLSVDVWEKCPWKGKSDLARCPSHNAPTAFCPPAHSLSNNTTPVSYLMVMHRDMSDSAVMVKPLTWNCGTVVPQIRFVHLTIILPRCWRHHQRQTHISFKRTKSLVAAYWCINWNWKKLF